MLAGTMVFFLFFYESDMHDLSIVRPQHLVLENIFTGSCIILFIEVISVTILIIFL